MTAATLAEKKAGETVQVARLNTREKRYLHKLIAFGLLPGVSVRIIRRQPVLIVAVENTVVALDSKMAGFVQVAGGEDDKKNR